MSVSSASAPLRITPTKTVLGRVRISYPRIRHLLVPLDFSGKSRQALRYALPLAHKFAAKIVLLHVLPAGKGSAESAAGQSRAALRQAAQKRLEKTAAQLVPPPLLGACVILAGQPAAQIVAAVDRHDIDLIVINTKGRSGLKRLLVGSTAEYVMRHATCPVLSVRRT